MFLNFLTEKNGGIHLKNKIPLEREIVNKRRKIGGKQAEIGENRAKTAFKRRKRRVKNSESL